MGTKRNNAAKANDPPRAGDTRGLPGDGAGRTEDPGTRHAGVWPVSGPPSGNPEARPRPMDSFGQGARGAAGYEDHGDSEMQAVPPGDDTPRERRTAARVGETGGNFGEVDPGIPGSAETVGETPAGAG